jgi:uncharacterized cupredoxin-like copper-binding protein
VPLALSTGHEVGLGVTALAFIAFALASSLLLPRFTAVENFGGESKHGEAAAAGSTTAETTTAAQTTTQEATTTQAANTTTAPTTTAAKPVATKVQVSETEFKITTDLTSFKAGQITFVAKNDGKIPHDLAVKETGDKTKEIAPGGTAELKVDLKPGKYELYCTIPGHEAAGMKLTITVS